MLNALAKLKAYMMPLKLLGQSVSNPGALSVSLEGMGVIRAGKRSLRTDRLTDTCTELAGIFFLPGWAWLREFLKLPPHQSPPRLGSWPAEMQQVTSMALFSLSAHTIYFYC